MKKNKLVARTACLITAVGVLVSSSLLVHAAETTMPAAPSPVVLAVEGREPKQQGFGLGTGAPNLALMGAEDGLSSNMIITGYKVYEHGSRTKQVTKVHKGDKVDIEVTIINKGLTTSDIDDKDALDITKPVDSFQCDEYPKVKITSSKNNELEFTVTFTNAVYSGTGNSFRFLVSYDGLAIPYDTGEISVLECVDSSGDGNKESPLIQVTRNVINTPIAAGDKFTLTLHVNNLSKDVSLENIVASFDTSESLTLLEASSSKIVPNIASGKSADITLSMQAASEIPASSQNITVNLKFDSVQNGVRTAGTATEKVVIPTQQNTSKENASPLIQISRNDIKQNISPGQTFALTVHINNLIKDMAMENILASFEPTDSLMLMESSSSKVVPNIAAGKSGDITLNLMALKEVSSANQGVNVNLKFDSVSGGGRTASTASEKLSIPVTPTTGNTDSATPYVIISQYQYGDMVPAGKTFDLQLTFKNTSRTLPVENIVLTLETGEGLSITSSSNSFSFNNLGPGASQSVTVPMQALASAKPENSKIDVSFKYEYVDSNKRNPVTSTEKLSIPVYQPDRFEITPPVFPEPLSMGQESTLSLSYVNKGKSEIANVAADLEGEVESPMAHLNLGNFEAGKSGTIDFVFTPMQAGEQTITVKVSYEDANLEVKELSFPVKITVAEPMVPEGIGPDGEFPGGEMDPMGGEGNGLWILWVVLACVGAGIGALIVWRVVKKKKKSRQKEQEELAWNEEQEEEDANPLDAIEPQSSADPENQPSADDGQTEEDHHEGV